MARRRRRRGAALLQCATVLLAAGKTTTTAWPTTSGWSTRPAHHLHSHDHRDHGHDHDYGDLVDGLGLGYGYGYGPPVDTAGRGFGSHRWAASLGSLGAGAVVWSGLLFGPVAVHDAHAYAYGYKYASAGPTDLKSVLDMRGRQFAEQEREREKQRRLTEVSPPPVARRPSPVARRPPPAAPSPVARRPSRIAHCRSPRSSPVTLAPAPRPLGPGEARACTRGEAAK